jgi:hypothetical protein
MPRDHTAPRCQQILVEMQGLLDEAKALVAGVEPKRPAKPTVDYCCLAGNKIRWVTEKKVPPRLWQLLYYLIRVGDRAVDFAELREVLYDALAEARGRVLSLGAVSKEDRSIVNDVSKLSQALDEILFPWSLSSANCQVRRVPQNHTPV